MLVVTCACFSTGSVAAQACPAPLLKQPAVRIAVAIDGCDYLYALAEDRHTGTSNCAVLRRNVLADSSSRVHTLSRMLEASFRPIFAHHFGFLSWPASPDSSAWSATVSMNQPRGGIDSFFQIVLRRPAGGRDSSDRFDFEKINKVQQLLYADTTQRVLDSVAARWSTTIDSLLEAEHGFKRDELVRTVFSNIPIAALTAAEAAVEPDGPDMSAPVPMRDTDIHVRLPYRPKFKWQVERVERGQPPIEDQAVFVLGECRGRSRYSCTLLELRYGAKLYLRDQIRQFFDSTARLHPPIVLHVVEYRPAADTCGFAGRIPR
jgi:hypothetical protein